MPPCLYSVGDAERLRDRSIVFAKHSKQDVVLGVSGYGHVFLFSIAFHWADMRSNANQRITDL
jgi:hypothetical protein